MAELRDRHLQSVARKEAHDTSALRPVGVVYNLRGLSHGAEMTRIRRAVVRRESRFNNRTCSEEQRNAVSIYRRSSHA